MGRETVVGLVVATGVLAVAVIVGGKMLFNRESAPPAPRKTAPAEREAGFQAARGRERPIAVRVMPPPHQEQSAPEPAAAPVADTPQMQPDRAGASTPRPTSPPPRSGGGKAPPQSPEARDALSRVGFDPLAEVVWLGAINDPDLPANERKDLIEDLNEDGFPDPKNITSDDLPLIMSRIALIEELWPAAMDEINAEAFREAYKDLVNMYFRLAGL